MLLTLSRFLGGLSLAVSLGFAPTLHAEVPPAQLSTSEKAAIRAYTEVIFADLNQLLRKSVHYAFANGQVVDKVFVTRGDVWHPVLARLDYQLNSALARLPDYTGSVWRGEKNIARAKAAYPVGQMIRLFSFTSASTDPAVAAHFSGLDKQDPDAVVIRLESQTGKLISAISGMSAENEVLFHSRADFRVVSARQDAGAYRVVLREIPPARQSTAERAALLKFAQDREQKLIESGYPNVATRSAELAADARKAQAFWATMFEEVEYQGQRIPRVAFPLSEEELDAYDDGEWTDPTPKSVLH